LRFSNAHFGRNNIEIAFDLGINWLKIFETYFAYYKCLFSPSSFLFYTKKFSSTNFNIGTWKTKWTVGTDIQDENIHDKHLNLVKWAQTNTGLFTGIGTSEVLSRTV